MKEAFWEFFNQPKGWWLKKVHCRIQDVCVPRASASRAASVLLFSALASSFPLSASTKATKIKAPEQQLTSSAALPALSMPKALPEYRARTAAPYVRLGALESTEGEDLREFVLRVAGSADAFTRATGQEACGLLMRSETTPLRYRIELSTNRAQVRCVMIDFPQPGFVRLGPTLHTHPAVNSVVMANAVDARMRPQDFFCGKRMFILWPLPSEGDLAHGEGYLVAGGRVLYQRGKSYPFQMVGYYQPRVEPLIFSGNYSAAYASHAAAAWQSQESPLLPLAQCSPAQLAEAARRYEKPPASKSSPSVAQSRTDPATASPLAPQPSAGATSGP